MTGPATKQLIRVSHPSCAGAVYSSATQCALCIDGYLPESDGLTCTQTPANIASCGIYNGYTVAQCPSTPTPTPTPTPAPTPAGAGNNGSTVSFCLIHSPALSSVLISPAVPPSTGGPPESGALWSSGPAGHFQRPCVHVHW